MSEAEAFEILGLTGLGVSSAGELKRAYLKQVRQHPPERDPEGFRRVRDAYELLQQSGSPPVAGAPQTAPVNLPAAPPPLSSAELPTPTATPIERLVEALNARRPKAAGQVLLEIYADPKPAAELPPPQIPLQVV